MSKIKKIIAVAFAMSAIHHGPPVFSATEKTESDAGFKEFSSFIEGPWGLSSESGQPRSSSYIDEAGKYRDSRKSCPASGLKSPNEMDDPEMWFEMSADKTLLGRYGAPHRQGENYHKSGERFITLKFIGMKNKNTAIFDGSMDFGKVGKVEISIINKNQIVLQYNFITQIENSYVRCPRTK